METKNKQKARDYEDKLLANEREFADKRRQLNAKISDLQYDLKNLAEEESYARRKILIEMLSEIAGEQDE